jgi:hypothetical protein
VEHLFAAETDVGPLRLVVQHELFSLQWPLPFDEKSLLHCLLDFRKYSDLLSRKTVLEVSGAVVNDPEIWIKFVRNMRLFANDTVSLACVAGQCVNVWTKAASMHEDFYGL